ncbi:MAG: DUF4382 domain-containing protein [Merismopedia sp. SIO2A8]|nr:DUF4382 domain-containing protein [Merismopedia sp. SIO2A8]
MKLSISRTLPALCFSAIALSIISCSSTEPIAESSDTTNNEATAPVGTGTLEFRANGEDFVRQGFVSKDGWQIEFDHLYVNLADVKAYQTSEPYDPEDKSVDASQIAEVSKETTVDLAEGDANADPVLIEAVNAPAGRYSALSWKMIPASAGPAKGSTLMMVGSASRDEQTIPFTIQIDSDYSYTCGEYVGDERKGFLDADAQADIEATFHFDHIFGDGEAPADDSINTGALGFDPLAALATDGKVMADMASLKQSLDPQDYSTLEKTLLGLAHVGEGHCSEASGDHSHGS